MRKVAEKPRFSFDGGHIAVPFDQHHEAVEWYSTHLGLSFDMNCSPILPTAKGSLLKFAGWGNICLVSHQEENEHFRVSGDVPSRISFTLTTPDIQAAHAYFNEQGIKTSARYRGPGRSERFDFYDPFGTRLTAAAGKSDKADRFIGFELPVIQVKNLESSKAWYRKHLGLGVNSKRSKDPYTLLTGFWNHHDTPGDMLWLEKRDGIESGDIHSAVRAYFYVEPELLTGMHEKLQKNGVNVSCIVGKAFHVFDPDGNRINVYS